MLFVIGLVVLCFFLGYILLVTLDHVSVNSVSILFGSTCTVFSQFGLLIFSPLIISQFSNDYKEKNIIFYRTAGFSATQYFINKVCLLIGFFSVAIITITVLFSLLFRDFTNLLISIVFYELITSYYIIVVSLWAFLFKSFIFSFFSSFSFWILTILISSFDSRLYFFAYYDASATFQKSIIDYINGIQENGILPGILGGIVFNILLFTIVTMIITLFKKRWIKNGV